VGLQLVHFTFSDAHAHAGNTIALREYGRFPFFRGFSPSPPSTSRAGESVNRDSSRHFFGLQTRDE
jgi:hypothetical protein